MAEHVILFLLNEIWKMVVSECIYIIVSSLIKFYFITCIFALYFGEYFTTQNIPLVTALQSPSLQRKRQQQQQQQQQQRWRQQLLLSWSLFVCGTAAAATSPQSPSNKSQSLLANGGKATSLYRHLNCTLNPWLSFPLMRRHLRIT